MGLVRALGSLLVVGALAGSGYAAYELYDAQQVRVELDGLRSEVRDLRDRQAGMRAGGVTSSDLGSLTQLVRQLDGDVADLRTKLARPDDVDAAIAVLQDDVDRLARSAAILTSCLERGLLVDQDGRARC